MPFLYEQLTGRLLRDDDVIGVGYAGAGVHKNNPASEGLVDEGPLPCGTYTVKGPPYDDPKHGKFVLRLVPDAETRARIIALGRDPDSFLLHGDKIGAPGTASEGCIVQARDVRGEVWSANAVDNTLKVVSGIPDTNGDIAA